MMKRQPCLTEEVKNCRIVGEKNKNEIAMIHSQKLPTVRGLQKQPTTKLGVSLGKSIRQTNLPPKKRTTRSSLSTLVPTSSNSRKRRRCLPLSKQPPPSSSAAAVLKPPPPNDSASEIALKTNSKEQKSSLKPAPSKDHPKTKPTEQTNNSTPTIKKNFPGKLYRLVDSCTPPTGLDPWKNHPQTVIPQSKKRILSWLVAFGMSAADDDNNCRGYALAIWDKEEFLQSSQTKEYFSSQSSFRSFERQLNSWGFKRQLELELRLLACQAGTNTLILTKDSLRVFFHPYFQPQQPSLLAEIKRRRQPGRGINNLSNIVALPGAATTPSSKQNVESRVASNDHGQSEDHQQAPAIRTDVILPDGVCLRVNKAIPTWAIPAQESAVQYLYQKHSKSGPTASALGTLAAAAADSKPAAVIPFAKKPVSRPKSPPSSQESIVSTSSRSVLLSEGESIESDSSSSSARSSKDTLVSDMTMEDAELPGAVSRRIRDSAAFGDSEDRLGSLLQPQQHRLSQTTTDKDDEDQFCDASEDEECLVHQKAASTAKDDENDDKWLVI